MEDKTERTPVIDPLIMALKSRRVLIAICTLLVGLLIMLRPELAAVQSELIVLLITLALAVIGGYSVEDAAAAGRGASSEVTVDVTEGLREVINAIIDETFSTRFAPVPGTIEQVAPLGEPHPSLIAQALDDDTLLQEVKRRQQGDNKWVRAEDMGMVRPTAYEPEPLDPNLPPSKEFE